ncbi:hypothetical protein BDW22DRAFT_1002480 [Trametopsis cervina]|nr:hypothetical protein BDW22DRAFT_1002480 [Trametopsis cervina]
MMEAVTGSPHLEGNHLGAESATTSSCAILRLPSELLGEISLQFTWLCIFGKGDEPQEECFDIPPPIYRDPFCPSPEATYYYGFYRWLAVAHICHRWREAALATPAMWATIRLTNCTREGIQTMIERSGQVPLSFFEDGDLWGRMSETLDPKSIKSLVLQQLGRTQHLNVSVRGLLCNPMSDPTETEAPLLRTLIIRLSAGPPLADIPVLSSGKLPSLTRLVFGPPSVAWDFLYQLPSLSLVQCLLRPNLTHLHIHAVDELLSCSLMLDILRQVPLLRRLHLGDVLARLTTIPDFEATPSDGPLVTLSHLHEISLQRDYSDQYSPFPELDGCTAAADLLRHLVFPSTTDIFLSAGNFLSKTERRFVFSVLKERFVNGAQLGKPFVDLSFHITTSVYHGEVVHIPKTAEAASYNSHYTKPRMIQPSLPS